MIRTLVSFLFIITCALPSVVSAQHGAPTPVVVAPVEQRLVQDQRLVTGNVRAIQRSQIAAREGGLVRTLEVEEGQALERGDVIATLDSARIELAIAQLDADALVAGARQQRATATLRLRQRDHKLVKSSYDRGAANDRELNDAISELQIAEAAASEALLDLDVIKARRRILDQRRDDMQIVAPFDGVVVSTATEQGQWIGEGDTVVEVISTGAVEVWLDVPQRLLAIMRTAPESLAIAIDSDDLPMLSDMIRVVPVVDSNARTFTVIATLPNEKGELAPGMSVVGWVPTESASQRLLVHPDAIMRNEAGPFVYMASSMGPEAPPSAMPVAVTIRHLHEGMVVVDAGRLHEGANVIIEGNERLFPMMPVQPMTRDELSTQNKSRDEGTH